MTFRIVLLLFFCIFFSACKDDVKAKTAPMEQYTMGIEPVPKNMNIYKKKGFVKYTKIIAPNGKPIRIFAQDEITNEQMLRAKNILQHYLNSYKTCDKTQVANKMAQNKAVLLLANGKDEGIDLGVDGQPLYHDEIQVEGSKWYVEQDYEHRDASFEEILHLVHDTGIGVDGKNSNPGAKPALQQKIRAAQKYALANKIWGLNSANWIEELEQDNSLSQEYLAALIDAYYGLWGAWQEDKKTSMWGIYTPRDRKDIAKEDKLGQKIVDDDFFQPYLTYNARISKSFKGTFWLKFNPKIPYTHHARYLKDITLLGKNNTNVRVNELDNIVTGNDGINTVIFSGNFDEYDISTKDKTITVKDNTKNRDGTNYLSNIEKLQFSDKIKLIK